MVRKKHLGERMSGWFDLAKTMDNRYLYIQLLTMNGFLLFVECRHIHTPVFLLG